MYRITALFVIAGVICLGLSAFLTMWVIIYDNLLSPLLIIPGGTATTCLVTSVKLYKQDVKNDREYYYYKEKAFRQVYTYNVITHAEEVVALCNSCNKSYQYWTFAKDCFIRDMQAEYELTHPLKP